MTPHERRLLRKVGLDLLTNWITIPASVSLCYSLLIPIASIVTYNFLRLPDRNHCSLLQSAITFIGIVAFTAFLAMQIGVAIAGSTFFENDGVPFCERAKQIDSLVIKLATGQNWLQYIPLHVNDAFILWRAWVIINKRRWAQVLSIGLSMSNAVVTIVCLLISRNFDFPREHVPDRIGNFFQLSIAIVIFSFINNLVATFFTGWTFLQHKQFLCRDMRLTECHTSPLWRAILLVVESGILYAVLQFIFILMHFLIASDQEAADLARQAFDYTFFSVSFMYPALTVALIRGISLTVYD